MLDLNIDHNRIDFDDRQHSGTSVSSDVLDDDSVSYSYTMSMNTTTDHHIKNRSYQFGPSQTNPFGKGNPNGNGLITRQFFPVGIDLELEDDDEEDVSITSSLIGSSWLNLKVPETVLPDVQKVPVMVPMQAKKSRRGPRSRSSQYRGVTFYRRTGRWESHIWYHVLSF